MMHFPSFTLGITLLLNALPALGYPSEGLVPREGYGGGNFCWPKGTPQKLVLNFDDIPSSPTSDFSQLGEPGGVPFVYNGFTFIQDQQWYLLRCNNFENVPWAKLYYQSCGGSPQGLSTSGRDNGPESILTGPKIFDVDSFFITPVQFSNTSSPVTLKVTGKNYIYDGWTASYEVKVKPDVRNEIKGLRDKGFLLLKEVEIHVYDDAGQVLGYVLDDVAVRKWEYGCW